MHCFSRKIYLIIMLCGSEMSFYSKFTHIEFWLLGDEKYPRLTVVVFPGLIRLFVYVFKFDINSRESSGHHLLFYIPFGSFQDLTLSFHKFYTLCILLGGLWFFIFSKSIIFSAAMRVINHIKREIL